MTLKQQKALTNLVENGRPVGQAMRDAGYSEAMATHPDRLTKSKGFGRLVAAMDELSRKKYGLDSDIKAVEVYTDALSAEKTDITGDQHPDHKIRMDAADRVLEVQGLRQNITLNQFNVGEMSLKFEEDEK